MRENGQMAKLVSLNEISDAQRRIADVAVRTGLYRVEPERLQTAGMAALPFELYVKAENEQPIGSFKLRGAYNRIAQLSADELRRGVITYSSGNHAQGVAFAARALGAQAVIVMPENAPVNKREATLALGAEVVLVGPASSERKAKPRSWRRRTDTRSFRPTTIPRLLPGRGRAGWRYWTSLGRSRAQ